MPPRLFSFALSVVCAGALSAADPTPAPKKAASPPPQSAPARPPTPAQKLAPILPAQPPAYRTSTTTPQQAIQNYRNSGSAYPARPVRSNVVPPSPRRPTDPAVAAGARRQAEEYRARQVTGSRDPQVVAGAIRQKREYEARQKAAAEKARQQKPKPKIFESR
ncbi:MAG: hypothetical protein JSR82_03340 [Verrucomicrobia bacterium]|nr:hypothetical protein [Verrucomicrobiota bacterium]